MLACWTSGPMASWPEKSTRLSGFPVTCAKAIASPPTASATTGTTTKGRSCRRRAHRSPDPHDDEDGDRHDGGQQDRPAERSERRRVVLGQREWGDGVGTRAETRHRTHADEHQRADPGGQQSRQQDDGKGGAPETGCLDDDHRPDDRGTEQGGDGGEARGGGDQRQDLIGGVLPRQLDREDAETRPERDQRRFGAEHDAQADGGDGGEQHARQFDGLGRRSRLQPFGGLVTAAAREPPDGEGDRDGRDGQHRQRPPRGNRCQAQRAREVLVDPQLQVVDEFEIAPRRQGDQDTDDGGEDEQHAVVPGPQERGGIGRRRSTGGGGVGHRSVPRRASGAAQRAKRRRVADVDAHPQCPPIARTVTLPVGALRPR